MPYLKTIPTDNQALNLMWIGTKPLPKQELVTFLRFNASKDLPVILWVDNPLRMEHQIAEMNVARLTPQGSPRFNIRSVKELFMVANETQKQHETTQLLNAMQQREAYGAGNLGARVDLIKAQLAYRVGGLLVDFDTLEVLYQRNGTDITKVLREIKKWLSCETPLLYRMRTGQPDLLVAIQHTKETDWLREIQIDVAKRFAATDSTSEKYAQKNPRFKPRTETLFSCYADDPLFHLSPAFESKMTKRDQRRSQEAWQTTTHTWGFGEISVAKDLTLNETGSLATTFSGFKLQKIARDLMEERSQTVQELRLTLGIDQCQAEITQMTTDLAGTQLKAIPRKKLEKLIKTSKNTLTEKWHELEQDPTLQSIDSRLNGLKRTIRQEHDLQRQVSGDFDWANGIYTDTWLKPSERAKQPAYEVPPDFKIPPCSAKQKPVTVTETFHSTQQEVSVVSSPVISIK